MSYPVEHGFEQHVGKMDWGLYCEEAGGSMRIPYFYNGKFWKPLDSKAVEDEAEAWIYLNRPDEYSASRVKSCSLLVENILSRRKKFLNKEKGRNLISTKDCILEIFQSGKLKVIYHNKSLFIKNYCDINLFEIDGVKFGFDAGDEYKPRSQKDIENDGSLFSQLIKNAFGNEEVLRAWQESFGDTLLSSSSQVTPVLIGSGGQGKSQWLQLAQALHFQNTAVDLSRLSGFSLSSCIGKTLMIADEVDKKIDEMNFKRLFGGGTAMPVDRKFKDAISWVPDLKGIIGMNNFPSVSEHSEAIMRRVRLFPMGGHQHDKVSTVGDIAQKIIFGYTKIEDGKQVYVKSQLKDVFDWALHGAVRVQTRGRLLLESELPDECKIEKTKLRIETDPVWAFIEELDLKPVDAGGITKNDLYQCYVEWCENNGRMKMSSAMFGKQLKRNIERIYGSIKDDQKIEVVLSGTQERVWRNCWRLKSFNNVMLVNQK